MSRPKRAGPITGIVCKWPNNCLDLDALDRPDTSLVAQPEVGGARAHEALASRARLCRRLDRGPALSPDLAGGSRQAQGRARTHTQDQILLGPRLAPAAWRLTRLAAYYFSRKNAPQRAGRQPASASQRPAGLIWLAIVIQFFIPGRPRVCLCVCVCALLAALRPAEMASSSLFFYHDDYDYYRGVCLRRAALERARTTTGQHHHWSHSSALELSLLRSTFNTIEPK